MTQDGYVTAFYAVAELLGIGARAGSPAEVWEREMLPLLRHRLAHQTPPATQPSATVGADRFVIRRNGAFFRPNAEGYTNHVIAAGFYTREEADRYADVEGVTIEPLSRYRDDAERTKAECDRLLATLHTPPPVATARECPTAPDGGHQVDTSMESGPNNCFHCEAPMVDKA